MTVGLTRAGADTRCDESRHLKALFWGFSPVALLALALYLSVGNDAPPWQLALLAFFLLAQVVLAVVVIAAVVIERRSGDSPN